ncbi:MAG: hypothetical protein NTX15_02410 [Candidatus Kapabacteria bacterium]|nr:hypothetical protein [Candidatus Kapabacteria bacterium]
MSRKRTGNRRSVRLPWRDSVRRGVFLVTVCTYDRRPSLGMYRGVSIDLTDAGAIADDCIRQIPLHNVYVRVIARSVQPDHIHVLVELCYPMHEPAIIMESFSNPVPGSIATIVRSMKSAVTNLVRQKGLIVNNPFWQRGYDLRAIRSKRGVCAVRTYVERNTIIHIRRLSKRRRN